jgi:hypothetical protein
MNSRRVSTSVCAVGAVTLLAMSVRAAQPAATLKPDALDEPAATSVDEASRAAALAAGMAAGGHTMPHGTYTHRDAGRAGATPKRAEPAPKPSPAADPHHMHRSKPSPSPSPSPRNEERDK